MIYALNSIVERAGLNPAVLQEVRGSMVYIVDDDPEILRLLATVIEALGMGVTVCAGPHDLLSILNPVERGCIVIDYHMPEMSGLQLLNRLKQMQVILPAIMISGHSQEIDPRTALAAGAAAFLHKPFDLALLMDHICRAITSMSSIPPRP